MIIGAHPTDERGRLIVRLAPLIATTVLHGCFVELSGGVHSTLGAAHEAQLAPSIGFGAGLSLEPPRMGFAAGMGAQVDVIRRNGVAQGAQIGGGFLRLDLGLLSLGRVARRPLVLRVSAAGTYYLGRYSQDPQNDGRGFAGYLGPTLSLFSGRWDGFDFTVAGDVAYIDGAEPYWSAGARAVLRFRWMPFRDDGSCTGMCVLFRGGYRGWDRNADRDVQSNQRQNWELQRNINDGQRRFQENQDRERRWRSR